MSEIFGMKSVRGEELEAILWADVEKPVGIVQLVHGMCEHMRRYEDTARRLNGAGFIVVGHTHLGHNRNSDPLGYFGPKGGWDALVEDVHALRVRTQKRFPGLPYFLLGHSMGSFVVRTYCLRYEEGLAGVILSGTGYFPKGLVSLAGGIAKAQCALGMEKKEGRFLNKLTSMNNNKGYPDVRTPFDWLSRDRETVQRYIQDPYCGYCFTAGAFRDMFDGLSRLYPEKLNTLRADIPVYFLSGADDPVGSHGAGVKTVAEEWRAAGVKDVAVKLYPEGRHEMFNEINREEVWDDLIHWLNRFVSA